MNVKQVNHSAIVNEWQLGQQLNNAVHHNTRDKFNLLLSFLSEDARDFAEFEVQDNDIKAEKEALDLRQHFNLNKAQPLSNDGPSRSLLAEFNDDLHKTKLIEIRFKQLLTNEALLSQTITQRLPDEIIDNLSLVKRERLEEAHENAGVNDHTIAQGIEMKLNRGISAIGFKK